MSSLNLNQGWSEFLTQQKDLILREETPTSVALAILHMFPQGPVWIRRGGSDWGVCPLSSSAVIVAYPSPADMKRVQYCYQEFALAKESSVRLSWELPSFEEAVAVHLRALEREKRDAVLNAHEAWLKANERVGDGGQSCLP